MNDCKFPLAIVENDAADRLVTIPLAEYHYLTRIDALMDVLINDESYRKTNTIDAVLASIKAMRGVSDEAVGLE